MELHINATAQELAELLPRLPKRLARKLSVSAASPADHEDPQYADGLITHGDRLARIPPQYQPALELLIANIGSYVTQERIGQQTTSDRAENLSSAEMIRRLREIFRGADLDLVIETARHEGYRLYVVDRAAGARMAAAHNEHKG